MAPHDENRHDHDGRDDQQQDSRPGPEQGERRPARGNLRTFGHPSILPWHA